MLKSSCLGPTVSTQIVTNVKVACYLGAIKFKKKVELCEKKSNVFFLLTY